MRYAVRRFTSHQRLRDIGRPDSGDAVELAEAWLNTMSLEGWELDAFNVPAPDQIIVIMRRLANSEETLPSRPSR